MGISAQSDDPNLPLDPDVEVEETTSGVPRPAHVRPGLIALVFAGGIAGTAAREALSLAWPDFAGIPVATFSVNVVGAFLLGVLLEYLARDGPDLGKRRGLRLLLGTGFLGGFTTYSTLATQSAGLLSSGSLATGISYAIGTLLIGAAASFLGIALSAAIHRSRGH